MRRTAADLLERAEQHAATLLALGVRRGAKVGVIGLNRPEWAEWAYGIWLTGNVLVPLPAPIRVRDRAEYADQIRTLADAMGCELLVGDPRYLTDLEANQQTHDWQAPAAGVWDGFVPPAADDLALVLCTSGSTSLPKGAAVTHGAIAARERARAHAGLAEDGDLTWLPLFHTGGILALVRPIYHRLVAHIFPTERFARDPLSWFRLVGEVEATSTAAASSAWHAALQAAVRKPEGIDLSSLHRAVVSLETIDPDVVDELVAVGSQFGLRPEVPKAMYGMSECTGITATGSTGIRIETIDLDVLTLEGRAVPAAEGALKRVASCGQVGPGVELRIVDSDGRGLGEREVGEIVVRSGGLMRGYIGQADTGIAPDGWFATGDVGYLAEGELFITGRVKELIISHGHKYHPEDIERAAARGLGIAPDRVIAFGRPDGREGSVIVLVEVDEASSSSVASAVRDVVYASVGQLPLEVVAMAVGSLPKTPTGKMRRNQARQEYALSRP